VLTVAQVARDGATIVDRFTRGNHGGSIGVRGGGDQCDLLHSNRRPVRQRRRRDLKDTHRAADTGYRRVARRGGAVGAIHKVNPQLRAQLANAFGLVDGAELDALIAALRSGAPVDAQVLRQGCLALLDTVGTAQAASAASDQRLKIALESSALGLWEWNLATGAISVDHTYCSITGRKGQDATWENGEFTQLVHPDDRAIVDPAARATLSDPAVPFNATYRVLHSDGRWLWLESFGSVTERDANGRVLKITGTHMNVTERKQMERALSNTLRVMQALLETLPLPVVIRDSERRVTLVNEAWEKMLGVPRTDIIGRQLDDVTNRVHTAATRDTDDELFSTKRSLRYETTIQSLDGTAFNVLIAKTPLLAEDGTVTGIASVLTDISSEKRTSQALERARLAAESAVQAKSRFLANMSHELRTPLNGVVGMASLLENTALDAKQRRFVRTLKSSAEALITLINDVLDLSKAEAGKLDLSYTSFELRKELEHVVGLFSARAHDQNIEVAAHIARDVPAVINGDPIRLRQILGNLVNNAVKFTEAGAVLVSVAVVSGDAANCLLEFAVTDSGVGIEPAEQARIFEAFEQADGSVTRRFGGTGLGLAISRQLVELMRGTMGLESERGRGSRFSFRIPVDVARAELPAPAPAADLGSLVIGMHPIVRSAVCEVLSVDSAHVISVDSSVDALEALRDFGARITRIRVILDANAAARMEQTVSGLRAAAAPRTLEVLALLPPDADATPPAGVSRVLVKPLCTADLATSSADTAQSTRLRALPEIRARGRALVVEDNAVNQEMARAMLDMLGFEVSTASNGREGVAAAAADPAIDLILMDCQMPVMDGLAAARAIRAAEPKGSRVAIVALTGNAMPGDREACMAAGMDDYLAKPFSLSALRAMLDKWTPPAALTASTGTHKA
jgi:PAS domain S-box-containing protein